MPHYHILGLMSGSSLDGVDAAFCSFLADEAGRITSWEMEHTTTLFYPVGWTERLARAANATLPDLMQLDSILGQVYATMIQPILPQLPRQPDAIALHGHTVRHQPADGYSLQLGAGAIIARRLGLPVITQLRDPDLEAGGQGAPLAPIADQLLFPGYAAYLNLGGIANVYIPAEKVAYDTGGANQLLNELARQMGHAYDDRGRMAATGHMLAKLFRQLNELAWFSRLPPKSLSNQWVQKTAWPLIESAPGSIPDKLYTVGCHIAWHVGNALRNVNGQVLVTGGGAHNEWLIDRIRDSFPGQVIIPKADIVNYKEAALTALLGYLCLTDIPAPVSDLTGARHNTVPGALYLATPSEL